MVEKDLSSYHEATDYLNFNNTDIVSLQHEFGIFGGVLVSFNDLKNIAMEQTLNNSKDLLNQSRSLQTFLKRKKRCEDDGCALP